jgi:NAD-dependent DNA ligase
MSIASPRDRNGLVVPSALPLDYPVPEIIFRDRSFCFTGVFEFGRRVDCHGAVELRGGVAAKAITKNLNYLVIGNVGSEMWLHTSFGLKIAKAVECRDSGASLSIITEKDWVAQLN